MGIRQVGMVIGLLALLSMTGTVRADDAAIRTAGPVLLVGDSMMRSLERSLTRALARMDLEVHASSSIGTGLARLDIYDWPTELASLAAAHEARTVFIMIGANDNQPMQTGGGVVPHGSDLWQTEYGRRVGKTMDAVLEAGAERIVWIGLPCMREAALDADIRGINAIVYRQAAARPRVHFIETYERFSRNGAFSPYIILDNGMPLNIRARDGIHLSRPGSDHLAGILIDELNARLRAASPPDA